MDGSWGSMAKARPHPPRLNPASRAALLTLRLVPIYAPRAARVAPHFGRSTEKDGTERDDFARPPVIGIRS